MFDIEAFAESNKQFDNQYILIKPLSTNGGTADVWLAVDIRTVDKKEEIENIHYWEDSCLDRLGLLVAIKIYRPKNALDIEGEQRFKDEYTIVFNCHHTNLIHPTHFSIFNEIPYLVLPYCKNGSSELLIGNLYETKDIWKYVYDVASGLDYLHSSCTPPIIHQDIKPANVLLDDYGNYSITDFGISSIKYDNLQDYWSDDNNSGTLAYMAPERFNLELKPSAESDIWALGATLCELITGRVPFGEYGGEAQAKGEKMIPLPKTLSKEIKNLIHLCLNLQPEKRPTAAKLVTIARKNLEKRKPQNPLIWAGLSIIVLICISIWFIPPQPVPLPTYNDALKMLYSSDKATKGIAVLDSLSQNGDSNASYLLSRIYFVGKQTNDNNAVEDSVKAIKRNLSNDLIMSKRHLSHPLLQTCVNQDSSNYHALYLLGLNYMGGTARQEGVERNIELARQYLGEALNAAKVAADNKFAKKVKKILDEI